MVFTEHDHFGSAFALSEHGDAVYLSAGSGGALSVPAYREFQDFGGQERDVTFGRHLRSDGIADFPAMVSPTMGAANSGPQVGPVVIEEIMYHPPTNGHEYVEIGNTSGATVPLYDPANPVEHLEGVGDRFQFPMGVQLTGYDCAAAGARHHHAGPVPVQLRGAGLGGDLQLHRRAGQRHRHPGVEEAGSTPEAATGYVPYIVVEQVKYNDSAPWPVAADGLGKALAGSTPPPMRTTSPTGRPATAPMPRCFRP